MVKELEGLEEGPEAEIHIDLLRMKQKKIPNWKTLGHDGIHGFCFKKFTTIHDRLAHEMNRCLPQAHVPEWISKGMTTLIQKDSRKVTTPNNYRPITCLTTTWKILTAQIREESYSSLTRCVLFREEQKGCCKGSRGTGELLYIDQHILKESKIGWKNQAMAWIDNKKAYDMVLQTWTINCFMYKISVINFIEKTMKTWRLELTAEGESLAKTKMQRGIFKVDALSALLFIIAMMPLNHILKKCTAE